MNTENTTSTADSGRLPDAARYPKLAALLDAHDAAMREWLCAESISEIEEIEKRINGQCSDNA